MIVSYLSDVGRVREINEDYIFVDKALGVLLLADGMGGHLAGEVASRSSCEFFYQELRKIMVEKSVFDITKEDIFDIYNDMNNHIKDLGRSDVSLNGMGTTINVLINYGKNAIISHIGDSRVYLISDKAITQVTKDHSVVQERVDEGLITKEEARHQRDRNILTQAIGTGFLLYPEIIFTEFKSDDIVLLCSDGLNDLVTDDRILQIVLESEDIELACQALVDEANAMGGRDNISVILATDFNTNIGG